MGTHATGSHPFVCTAEEALNRLLAQVGELEAVRDPVQRVPGREST